MMKASLKARYETDHKDTVTGGATVALDVGDFKLRASMTDAKVPVSNGTSSLNGLALAVEKPDSFIIDYDFLKQDFKFQFMNSIKVFEKPFNLKYIHSKNIHSKKDTSEDTSLDGTLVNIHPKNDTSTSLDGTLVINSANKVSVNHVMGSQGCKLKYSYVHGGLITFEPSYDTTKSYLDFALSRKVYENDKIRATYQTKLYNKEGKDSTNNKKDEDLSGNLGLEWSRSFNQNTKIKVSASLNLGEKNKIPKLSVESSWDFDI